MVSSTRLRKAARTGDRAEVLLSDKTVKNYVSSILSKLNLRGRAQGGADVAKDEGESGY